MDIKLNIKCLPDKLNKSLFTFKKEFDLIKNKEAKFYVKVTQENGHQAWSSPIYIKRK